jgi:hypothetical protein
MERDRQSGNYLNWLAVESLQESDARRSLYDGL